MKQQLYTKIKFRGSQKFLKSAGKMALDTLNNIK